MQLQKYNFMQFANIVFAICTLSKLLVFRDKFFEIVVHVFANLS